MSRVSWVNKVKVGDVILFGNNKTPRVVLEVKEHSPRKYAGKVWRRRYITMTIQRCSWTTRPTTTYVGYELERLAKHTKMKESLRSPIRKQILESIGIQDVNDLPVRCWEVVGIP